MTFYVFKYDLEYTSIFRKIQNERINEYVPADKQL